MINQIPEKQTAVELIGPDELRLNKNKQVYRPGPEQILCRVEAVGLCFSDLKLLKQFSSHVRKGPIVSGIDSQALSDILSYKKDTDPTVPGHEAVVRVCQIGENVKGITVGGRYLVQADYRWILTAASNAAFGYNFEGALQQYVLMDQRIITSPEGESTLIEASENRSASAIALVEPWACVEQAYAIEERRTLKKGGRLLIVEEDQADQYKLNSFIEKFGSDNKISRVSVEQIDSVDESFDDVLYFGVNAATAEKLFDKVAGGGVYNIILGGKKFDREINAAIGRIHYGGIRIIGTTTNDPAEAMNYIPVSGEIRPGDRIDVIGAGGPMGVMHVVRDLCHGVENVKVYAGDLDDDRLAMLEKICSPIVAKNKVEFETYNPSKKAYDDCADYYVVMAPVAKIVAECIAKSAPNGIVNIFAGIPANVSGQIDLNGYIEKHLYMIGTSGSTIDDMKTVLAKVESGRLDTDVSVGAISGFAGAIEGIRAVENRSISGKILVYPDRADMGLIELDELAEKMPDVAECLKDGFWNKDAEDVLLNRKKGN